MNRPPAYKPPVAARARLGLCAAGAGARCLCPVPGAAIQRVEQVADGVNAGRDQIETQPRGATRCVDSVHEDPIGESCRRRDGFVVTVKPECEQRISHRLGRRGEMAAILGGGPLLNRLLHGVGIQEGDGRMAVFAFARVLEVDGCAALRTGDLAHLCPDTLQFRRVQGADELFLAHELKERREPAVAHRAAEIREPAGFAQVEALHQGLVASRTLQPARPRPTRVVPVSVDFLEQPDDGDGRKLNARQMIEPYAGADETQIHAHAAVVVTFQNFWLHCSATVRAECDGR